MGRVWCWRLGWFALVGLLVSWLVAWAIAWRAAPQVSAMSLSKPIGEDRWVYGCADSPGSTYAEAVRVRPSDGLQVLPNTRTYIVTFRPPGVRVILGGSSVGAPAKELPPWVRLEELPSDRSVMGLAAYGWPCRCLQARVSGPPESYGDPTRFMATVGLRVRSPRSVTTAGLSVTPTAPGWLEGMLPVDPVWRGLAADVGIYASSCAAIWLTWHELGGPARAARRRRRGLCPHCAYDLRAEFAGGCPECGWGRDAP
jgi:hypothetical protein